MNSILLIINLIIIFNIKKILNNQLKNVTYNLNGIYIIKSLWNNYFSITKKVLILSDKQTYFRFIPISSNLFIIESKSQYLRLGVDYNNQIKLYNKNEQINTTKLYWCLYNINDNKYLIQNYYNKKFIEINNNFLLCNKDISISFMENDNLQYKNFTFIFLKLYNEGIIVAKNLGLIRKEPIDVLIKYIDLTDKKLNRTGIKQIYKDNDNEELRYSVRSILENIPWIRKIFILMPNEKVKFFKSVDEINDKIIYVNDNDLLGFHSANIFAFTFNLYKMEKFGLSKNFIYMEDDFFIGKPLKKQDFFFYNEKEKKVRPFLITKYFKERSKFEIFNKYNNLSKIKNLIHPHSSKGWWLSIYTTEKYFLEQYNVTLITTQYTHNAVAENIEELKEIKEKIKNYKYINETLFSKERHILTLNQPHFLSLYLLNIKHKKVHTINYRYIGIELINKIKLEFSLFVLNTGGNHIPLKRQYKLQKKIMEKRFPIKNKYEINNSNKIYIIKMIKICICCLKIFIIIILIKSFIIIMI